MVAVESHRSQGPHLHKEPLWSTISTATPPPAGPTAASHPTPAAAAAVTAASKAAAAAANTARSKAKAVSVAKNDEERRKKRAVEDSSDGEMDIEADIERAAVSTTASATANTNMTIIVRDSSVPLPTQPEDIAPSASHPSTRASQQARDLQQSLHAPEQAVPIDLFSEMPVPSEKPDEDYVPPDRIPCQSDAEEDTETEDNLPSLTAQTVKRPSQQRHSETRSTLDVPHNEQSRSGDKYAGVLRPKSTNAHTKNQ